MEQKRSIFMGDAGGPHPAPLRGAELWGQLLARPSAHGSPCPEARAGREGCSLPSPSGQLTLALPGPL